MGTVIGLVQPGSRSPPAPRLDEATGYWTARAENRVLAGGFRSIRDLDDFCADLDNRRAFKALAAADEPRARRLNAALRDLRRALRERAVG